jgi:hypothetical protein
MKTKLLSFSAFVFFFASAALAPRVFAVSTVNFTNGVWNSSGNVGIGTTAPGYTLDVRGTGNFTGAVNVGTPTAASNAATKSYVDSAVSGGNVNYANSAGVANGVNQNPNRTDNAWYQINWNNAAVGDYNLYSSAAVVLLSSGYGALGFNGGAWYIQGNSTYGLYSNTGLDANALYDEGNRVYSATNPPPATAVNFVNLAPTNAVDYWGGGSAYRTWMDNSATYHYGAVQDYAIHFTMDGEDSGRGFTWGANGATPSMSVDINGNLTLAGGGNFHGNLTVGANKITAGTFDPLYTIDGANYATYLPGMTGVNEETAGTLDLTKNADGTYSSTVNFASAAKGSDFWLFAQATNLKNTMDKLIVVLTPSFDGNVWYTKNAVADTLTIHGSAAGEVSYNLTAPRFDASQWPNTAISDPNAQGLLIK